MLTFKTQSQLVEATASVMRWYTLAAVNASAASASRGLSLWTEFLEASAARRGSEKSGPPKFGPAASLWWLGGAPWWNGWLAQAGSRSARGKAVNGAPAQPAAATGVAAYRSAGGHAVAQVTMGNANGQATPADKR